MGSKSIGRLLWSFSLPAIIGMLVNALYNVVDRIFVGRGVGSIAIAATTVAFPIMIILFAVSMLIGIGATALVSIRLGQQKKDEAEEIIGNALLLLILLPLILSIFYLFFSDPILVLFGASPDVLPYAHDFTRIIMLGSVFGSISFGVNNFIRAEGNPKIAMYTQLLGALINIVLNYFFIFHLGLGIKGSALATVCSQFFTALWVMGYFYTGRSQLKIRLKNLRPKLPIIISTVSIGFAPFAMQVSQSIQQTILNKTVFFYSGDIALSAVGIMFSIATLLFMPIVGLSQGAQPLIGYNYGAQKYDRVRETLKKAVLAGTCIAVVGFVIVYLFPYQIVGLFSEGDVALTELTTHAMKTFLVMMPFIAFQILCSNYFQAVGKPIQSTILSLSRQVLLFIPLLLILPRFWGIEGVWRTAPIADILSIMITATFIFVEMRHLPKTAVLTVQEDAPEKIELQVSK